MEENWAMFQIVSFLGLHKSSKMNESCWEKENWTIELLSTLRLKGGVGDPGKTFENDTIQKISSPTF